MTELRSITVTGLAATFFIVLMKLVTTRYYIPGVSEVFAAA